MKMNIESLTLACKLDRYEMKYVFVRTNLITTHLIFSLIRYVHNQSLILVTSRIQIQRESVNIYHVTLTLLKVQFLSCVLSKC